MEIALVSETSIRIRGKNASIIIDPSSVKTKTQADAILLLEKEEPDMSKIEGSRVVIDGPGEYEVGGIKISGSTSGKSIAYELYVDGVQIFLSAQESLKGLGQNRECSVVVVFAKSVVEVSEVTEMSPRLVILYGPGAKESVKGFGKEVTAASKIAATAEKLPAELEVALLE